MSDTNDTMMTLIDQSIRQDFTISSELYRHGVVNFEHTFTVGGSNVRFTRIATSDTVRGQPIRYIILGPGWRQIQIWLYNVPHGNVAEGRRLLAEAVRDFIGSPGRSLSFVQKSY